MTVATLDNFERLGWIDEPTPVLPLQDLANELGLRSLHVKRDDRCTALFGGTKPRKLDYVLAQPMYTAAHTWHGVGAIGSGQLVALIEAGRQLEKSVVAHCFFEPLSSSALDNLAYIASYAAEMDYLPSIWSTITRRPRLYVGGSFDGSPVVPPGATDVIGMLGTVRAGLELAEQVAEGLLPEPDRVLVALGTGGTAIGLSVGFAIAGMKSKVYGVATVSQLLSPTPRMRQLQRALVAHLRMSGVECPAPSPVEIDRRQLGDGYGYETTRGREAIAKFAQWDMQLEPVYTAKAVAALLSEPLGDPVDVLYWHTAGRTPPHREEWRTALPRQLARALDGTHGPSRRTFVIGAAAAAGVAVAGAGAFRFRGYDEVPNYAGDTLTNGEGHVLVAASTAVLPDLDLATRRELPQRVDNYVSTLPEPARDEVHALLAFVEHAAPLLVALRQRFSSLTVKDRAECMDRLARMGHPYDAVYGGIRDLCLLGYYQQDASWESIGYPGPLIAHGASAIQQVDYDALRAEQGAVPGAA